MPKRRSKPAAILVAQPPTLRVAGQATPQPAAALLDLEIRRALGQRTTCHARFSALDLSDGTPRVRFLDRELLDFGTTIEVAVAGRTLFTGPIAAITAEFSEAVAPAVGVRGEDAYGALATQTRRRTFEAMTDAGIAARIASERGFAATIDMPGPVLPRIVQADQTDLEFLRTRAAANRVDLILGDGGLVLRRRRPGRATMLALGAGLRSFSGTAAPGGTGASIIARAVIDASAAVELGGGVDLRGVGALFSGAHVVTEIVTRFDPADGLRTQISCERTRFPA